MRSNWSRNCRLRLATLSSWAFISFGVISDHFATLNQPTIINYADCSRPGDWNCRCHDLFVLRRPHGCNTVGYIIFYAILHDGDGQSRRHSQDLPAAKKDGGRRWIFGSGQVQSSLGSFVQENLYTMMGTHSFQKWYAMVVRMVRNHWKLLSHKPELFSGTPQGFDSNNLLAFTVTYCTVTTRNILYKYITIYIYNMYFLCH